MSRVFGSSDNSTITLPTVEGYGVEVNGDLLALQEAYEDQLAIVKAIHAHDMNDIACEADVSAAREAGKDQDEIQALLESFEVVSENAIKTVWQKVKDLFTRLWAKLKEFFGSVVRSFDGLFMSNKKFIEKYGEELKKKDLRGFEYKMFTYTNLESSGEASKNASDEVYNRAVKAVSGDPSSIKNIAETLRNGKEDFLNKARGDVVGKGTLTEEQYREALFAYYRGGATSSDDKKDQKVSIEELINVLKDTKAKAVVEKFINELNDEFTKAIKIVNDLERKFSNAKEEDGSYSIESGEHKFSANKDGRQYAIDILHAFSGRFTSLQEIYAHKARAWREAWAERDSEYRHACVAALRYKNKED